jgi:hypothetical protein
MRLKYGSFSNGVYFPENRNAGFFSLCSTSLLDLCSIVEPVTRVESQRLFKEFGIRKHSDLWSVYFNQPAGIFDGSAYFSDSLTYLHHHEVYRDSPLGEFQPYLKQYFSPSDRVLEQLQFFSDKYSIDPSRTIAVNPRGTDKGIEVPTPPLQNYLDLAAEQLSKNPTFQILAVSDQQQYLDAFLSEFGSKVTIIKELPTTTSKRVIHKRLWMRDRQNFGVNFNAAVLIMSVAEKVITHTGNGAFWTALYRGNTSGLVQLRGSEIIR